MTSVVGRRRVALLTNSVAVGGMEEHVRLIADLLDRDRFEVTAIVPDWEVVEPWVAAMRDAADRTEVITPDGRHGWIRHLGGTWRLFREFRRSRFDVVHFHSTTFRGQTLALAAARLAGIRRVLVTEHLAPDAPVPIGKRLTRRVFVHYVSTLICVSEKNRSARAQHLFTPDGKTAVVVNGVDIRRFGPIDDTDLEHLAADLGLDTGRPIVGTAVRLEPEKGLDDLLAAFAEVVETMPEAQLLVVGDGSLAAKLSQLSVDLGIRPHVTFAGFHPDPRPFLALMDVFVLPVPVGSMSIGLLEAMAMGCAPIITFGGEGEAVIHGKTGLCAEPWNPTSLASSMRTLLSDDALRAQLATAARTHVAQAFTAQRVARQLEGLYASEPATDSSTTARNCATT